MLRHLNLDAAHKLSEKTEKREKRQQEKQDSFLQSKQPTLSIRGEGSGLVRTRKTLQGLRSLCMSVNQYFRATWKFFFPEREPKVSSQTAVHNNICYYNTAYSCTFTLIKSIAGTFLLFFFSPKYLKIQT